MTNHQVLSTLMLRSILLQQHSQHLIVSQICPLYLTLRDGMYRHTETAEDHQSMPHTSIGVISPAISLSSTSPSPSYHYNDHHSDSKDEYLPES